MNDFTKEAVPFAGIQWKKAGNGTVSDSLGNFTLRKTGNAKDTLVVTYVGFDNVEKPFESSRYADSGSIVILLKKLNTGGEVVMKSKFNKGLRWWKNIVVHKAENNPYQYNSYSYELYNKLELDISNINKAYVQKNAVLKHFSFVLDNVDSNSESKPFLPVFLTESLSDYYYSNSPNKVREEIKAVQTNGIKNETVLQFVGGVSQKINVYENYLVIFNQEFISPLSNIGDRYYNYKGADTQIINGNKYFHLIFRPKEVGSNTFSGDCWIHSTTWAIQRINLNISATANINFVHRLSIVQEFNQTIMGKWVFAKDKFVVDMSPFKQDKITFIGRKTATYKNVQIDNPEIQKVLAQNKKKEEVIVRDSARMYSNNYWVDKRHEELSLNESNVYKMIDTLNKMPLFKQYTNTLKFIVEGRKEYGKIEIGPWYKWVSRNQVEKLRLRFDIGTTAKFNNHLRLNGYLAYGFNDKRFKGKIGFGYKVLGHESWQLIGSYKDDLDNGTTKFNDDEVSIDNMFSQLIRRRGIRQKFLGLQEYKFGIEKEWKNNVSATLIYDRSNFSTYAPLPSKKFFTTRNSESIINSQVGLKFRFAPGEKQIVTRHRRIKLKGNQPIFETGLYFGIPSVLNSEYSYQKVNASITHKVRLPRWGHVEYMLYGGKYLGNKIPFMLLEVHPGNEISYYNKQSFNLMNRFEYISDGYVGFNLEHNFGKKIFNLLPFMRKTNMRQFWNVKTVWGDLNKENRIFNKMEFGQYRFKALNKLNYTEVGTGIDNIFKYFRVDFVWRFAPNFRPPLNAPILKQNQNFGIFGSFHFQF